MITFEELYELELFEEHKIDDWSFVRRVPSGWVLTTYDTEYKAMTSCFIPEPERYITHEPEVDHGEHSRDGIPTACQE